MPIFCFASRGCNICLCLLFLVFGSVLSARAQAPTISSFSPVPVCQGSTITIKGTNFTGATRVSAGSIDASSFTVVDDNTITAVVSDAAVSGSVSVLNPSGTGSRTGLTVLPAPKPGLNDIGTLDAPFTNCDGNSTYQLRVSNASSGATGTGNAYKIDWGDGTAAFTQMDWSPGAQTNHTYTSQGFFTITMTITPSNGCVKSVTYRFYNGKNPLASFTTTASTTGLCVPAPVEFEIGNWYNNSAGTTYQIDFDDGTAPITLSHPLNGGSTVQRQSHTYTTTSCPNAVDFTATLKATNGCFTTTYTLNQIIIRKKPTADFSVQPSPPCVSGPVCFTNTTQNGYSGNSCNTTGTYLWNFGDGSTSSAQFPPCHTYANAGTYTVSLDAANTACGSSNITKQVVVLPTSPLPVAASPVVYCQGQVSVPLTATGSGLLWYTAATGGVGSATAPTPLTNVPGTKTYYVSQTLLNQCESQRVPVAVTVNALPPAPGVVSPVQLCQNQTAAALTGSGLGLLWYSSATAGTGSPTAPVPSTGVIGSTTYYVSQTTSGCEGPRASIMVVVNALATVPVVTPTLSYCQNETAVPLTATGSRLLWYTVATGGSGSATAPTPSTATAGSTTFYVSQITGCGEGPRASITVTVNARPSASISYSPSVFCNVAGASTVTPTVAGATGGSYSIFPAGLAIEASTGRVDPSGARAGIYTVSYTVPGSGGCGNFVTTATVTVNGTPAATISYPAICSSDAATNVVLTGTSGGTFSSTAGLTINAATGAITAGTSTAGTYVVTYTVLPSPPCPGAFASANVTITQAASATISYSPAVQCNVAGSSAVVPTVTGSTGGSYSISPATGLSMDPSTGAINASGATPGTYTIKYAVAGTGGCGIFTTTTSMQINGKPDATIKYPGSPFCRGISAPQKVTLSGTPGGTFSAPQGLSIDAVTGAINPSQSQPGTWAVTYTVAASPPCPGFVGTVNVVIDDSPVLTFADGLQSICPGGTATFHPSSSVANTVYSWSVVGALPANVAGASSGTASGVNPVISLSYTNSGANSQTLTIRVVPTNPSQNPCPGAPYDLTLTVNPVPAAPVPATVNLCMGDPAMTLLVDAVAGTTVKWYDNNSVLLSGPPVISTAIAGQYPFYASRTNGSGCESPRSKIMAVVNVTAKIIGSSFKNPTQCGIPSGSVVLDVLDLNNDAIPNYPLFIHYDKFGASYSIAGSTDAAGKITVPLVAGSYSGFYVETSGCMSQKIPDLFVLKDPTPPLTPVAGYNPPICSGTLLNLTALSSPGPQDGAIEYVWAGPAFGPLADTLPNSVVAFPSASMSDEGTYVVYAIQNNCISLPTSFQVSIIPGPSKPLIATRNPLCVGDDLNLQAYSTISLPGATLDFVWKGPAQGFPVHAPNAGVKKVGIDDGGIYTITVTSPQTGCSSSTDTLIRIGAYPVVQFARDTLTLPTGFLLKLEPVILNAADPGVMPIERYEWTPSRDLTCNDASCSSPVAMIKENTCYSVKAVNSYGCSGSDVICVKVFCQSSQIFIPNAFVPQGNVAENRKLIVRASGISSVRSFRVFNRWGKIVFERNNFPPNSPDYGWDGTINGRPADPGVYVYTAEVVCENGVPYTFKGNVTLL